MKTFVPVLALAAGVSATFKGAPPFTFPGNVDNKCTDKQKPGFSWDDLDLGDFFKYRDFNFNGWKCEGNGNKRGRFAPRTFGKKVIGGTCTSDKKKSPSFGCGAAVDKFSLGSIHVKPEFDCDLEFHYDMPDGSTCKHRNFCSKSGTTVVNHQCGGAKNVTIVYPPQPNKPKPSCSIQVPTISFDCSTASSTKPPKTKTSKPVTTPTAPAETTTTAPAETTTTSEVQPGQSSPAESTTTAPETTSTSPAPGQETTTSPAEESSTSSAETSTGPAGETSTSPAETSTSPAGETSTSPAETSTAPAEESSTSSAEQSTDSASVPASTIPPVTKTITTSYDSTSTIFTTSTQTITSCAPTVPNCPGNSVVTTVVTIPVSTTICPVTETLTTVESTSVPSSAATSVPGSVVTSTPVTGGGSSSSSSSGIVTSVKPVETLPCPSVVPSCLNTFLFTIGCDDNTDAACYCPDATFVKNVYDCLYAHGETDSIIAEAVAYFQGICGKWVSENPAIATDATVTTYITVTAAPTVAPVYTTVVVDVTTVVPCTNEAGEVIPSSSSTVTVSTSMTVPQVGFTTGPTGGVGVIPITSAPAVTGAPSVPAAGGSSEGGVVITTPGSTVAVPTGTGSFRPTASGGPVTAGVGRVGASFGMAAAVAFAAAAAL